MKIEKWLIINSKGAANLKVNKPRLASNEIAMQINIEVPDALFNKPVLVASIKVDDSAAASSLIESVVYDNVQEIIEETTGLNFDISIKSKTEINHEK